MEDADSSGILLQADASSLDGAREHGLRAVGPGAGQGREPWLVPVSPLGARPSSVMWGQQCRGASGTGQALPACPSASLTVSPLRVSHLPGRGRFRVPRFLPWHPRLPARFLDTEESQPVTPTSGSCCPVERGARPRSDPFLTPVPLSPPDGHVRRLRHHDGPAPG